MKATVNGKRGGGMEKIEEAGKILPKYC